MQAPSTERALRGLQYPFGGRLLQAPEVTRRTDALIAGTAGKRSRLDALGDEL